MDIEQVIKDRKDGVLIGPTTINKVLEYALKLEKICIASYQMAGAFNAPTRFLDALSDPGSFTDEQVEALLPVTKDEPGEFGPNTEAPIVQKGFVLVPLDATKEMITAGLEKYLFAGQIGMPEYDAVDAMEMAWDAMIVAAKGGAA
jgi:hypothetical protein